VGFLGRSVAVMVGLMCMASSREAPRTNDSVLQVAIAPDRLVAVHNRGAAEVGIYVAAGSRGNRTCAAAENERLYKGKVAAGATLELESSTLWVCIQQTYAPFTEVGYTSGIWYCRGRRSKRGGCAPNAEPIRIEIDSKPPG
jgi:hypothetical protein